MRANATHVLLIAVAIAVRSEPVPVMDEILSVWSNTNGSSMPCIVRSLPLRTGERQLK